MRLLTMLLMLCLSLLPAADSLKCLRSLIKETPGSQIQFNSATKTLTCTDKPNSIVAIHLKSRLFDGIDATPYRALRCDENSGWKANNKILVNEDNQIRASSSELYISCVEYCLSNGAHATKLDETSFEIMSITANNNCRIYYAWRQIMKEQEVYCTPYTFYGTKNGWMDERYHQITNEMTVPQQFDTKCNKEAPPPCTVELIELMRDGTEERSDRQYQDLDVNLLTKTLTCRNTNERSLRAIRYQYKNNKFRSGSLECDKVDGWKSKIMTTMSGQSIILNGKIADATLPLKVECVEYCGAPNVGIIYIKNGETVEVQCRDYFELRSLNSAPLTRVTCDVSGKWTLESEINKTKIDSPEFECAPKRCYMPNTDGIRFNKETKTLTCPDVGYALIAIEVNSELFSSVKCDDNDGWSGLVDGGRKKKFAEASAQPDFKCVNYCSSTEVTNATRTYSGEVESTEFKCYGNTANGNVYEIRLNENFVKPPLKCHIAQGYTDGSNTKLAGPLDNVKVDCATRPTTTSTSTSTTSTPTSSVKPAVSTSTHGSKTEAAEAQSSVTVVCASIGGVLLVIIAVVVIFIVLKKRRPENSENRKKSRGSKEKHCKGNDKSGAEQNSSGQ